MKILIICAMITLLLTPPGIVVLEETMFDDVNESELLSERTDRVPPESTLRVLPRVIIWPSNALVDSDIKPLCRPEVLVKWWGADNPEGSGVQSYDVQYMHIPFYLDPDTVRACVMPFWQDWQMNTTDTSAMFYPSYDNIFYFRCRARDNASNVEEWPIYFDSFLVCIGINYPPEGYSEFEDELDEWSETIEAKIESRLENIGRIAPETPTDAIERIIREIKANELPVANAGEDVIVTSNRFPRVYEDISDFEILDYFPPAEFNGSASFDPDGEIVGYLWDFGDGNYGCGELVTHRYLVLGEYNVTLTIIDNYGAVNQDNLKCTFNAVY